MLVRTVTRFSAPTGSSLPLLARSPRWASCATACRRMLARRGPGCWPSRST